ncbi:hypothetical protein [Actinophytocola oryzae]|uniref:Lipoprotein LpqN n=1 Tax=Actinophytocola oryzae TaxID=502181 RepID=A0A4R7VRW0_9PSEU|nr:hypothetical protein [Actinophytocola oryzae]TDV52099.1 hypothetical protein CLV71_105230 [Actinophytocola oryzae]
MRRLLIVAVGLLSLVVVACGPDTEAATPSSTAVPEPPPADRWQTTTDPATGISFALPGKAKVATRDGNAEGTTPDIRSYQVEVAPDLGIAVNFGEAAAADYSAAGLADVADSIVSQFAAQGATDTVVTDREETTVGDHPALDFRVSSTSKSGQKSIWLVRAIGDGTRVVQLQSIAFADSDDASSVTPVVERYHRVLLESLKL